MDHDLFPVIILAPAAVARAKMGQALSPSLYKKFKVHNNMAPEYLCQKFVIMRSTYDTRGSSSRFQLPLPKTNYGKNSFGHRGQFISNKLPEDLLGYKSQ